MRGTIHTIRWGTVFTLVLTAAAAAMTQGIAASTARADNIDYGDSPEVPPGVRFLDVIESSGTDAVPLLGQPDYFTTGIDFDPLGFTATETGGASDITEAQLNFTIASAGKKKKTPTVGVEQISLFKAGDYTLSGSGTSATQALAGTILRATVTEIDGESVSPINLIPVNASVGFNLLANPGVIQPWSLGLSMNVEGQLTALGVPFDVGATEVEVVMADSLIGLSEAGSLAHIAERDFRFDIVPSVHNPEPASLALAALMLCGLSMGRRRQKMHSKR